MRYSQLCERTPWHNQPRLNAVQQVKNLCNGDYENKFISFTKLEKLGVNPVNIHSTPIGLYTYPVQYALKLATQSDFSALPYAGNNQYIHFIEISPSANVWVMSDRSNIDEYANKLISYASDNSIDLTFKNLTPMTLYQSVAGLAKKITKKGFTTKMSIIFKNVFGIDALYDDGNGIIHSNEPTQMVIFNPKIIVQHKLLTNDTIQHNPAVKMLFGLEEPIIAVTVPEALRHSRNKLDCKIYRDGNATISTKIADDNKIFIVYTDEQANTKLNFVTTKSHVRDESISYGVVFGTYKGERIDNTQVSGGVTKQKLFSASEKFLSDKAKKNDIDSISNWFGIELKRVGDHKLDKTLKTVGKFNVKIDPDIDDAKVYIKGPSGIVSFCAKLTGNGVKVFDAELNGSNIDIGEIVVPNNTQSLAVVYNTVVDKGL